MCGCKDLARCMKCRNSAKAKNRYYKKVGYTKRIAIPDYISSRVFSEKPHSVYVRELRRKKQEDMEIIQNNAECVQSNLGWILTYSS